MTRAFTLSAFVVVVGCGDPVDVGAPAADAGIAADARRVERPIDSPCAPALGYERCEGGCSATCGAQEGCVDFMDPDALGRFGPGVCVDIQSLNPFFGDDARHCCVCPSSSDLCVQTEAWTFVCVPATLCDHLTAVGPASVSSPCLYQDKSRWTPAMTIEDLPCPPDAAERRLCGGACGGCGADETCTGRSPVHPFGICAAQRIVDEKGPYSNFCGLGAPCPIGLGCVTYVVGHAGVQRFADLYGFCIAANVCDAIATTQPDKYHCERR